LRWDRTYKKKEKEGQVRSANLIEVSHALSASSFSSFSFFSFSRNNVCAELLL
jgi:hypothetical protein